MLSHTVQCRDTYAATYQWNLLGCYSHRPLLNKCVSSTFFWPRICCIDERKSTCTFFSVHITCFSGDADVYLITLSQLLHSTNGCHWSKRCYCPAQPYGRLWLVAVDTHPAPVPSCALSKVTSFLANKEGISIHEEIYGYRPQLPYPPPISLNCHATIYSTSQKTK